MKRQVLNYVQEVVAESHSEAQLTTDDVAQDDDDLFSFMNSAGRQAAQLLSLHCMYSNSTCMCIGKSLCLYI